MTDILARVDAALREGDETDAALAQVEREVRRDWGGERPYIAKNGEGDRVRQEKSHRDERIRTDYRHGERIALLARRYGISERRVRMILAA